MKDKIKMDFTCVNKNFKSGILRILIIKKLENKKIHTYALMKEIQSNKKISLNVTKNDIYNVILAMEKLGLIKYTLNKKNKTQKVLELTPRGKSLSKKFKFIVKNYLKSLNELMVEMNE